MYVCVCKAITMKSFEEALQQGGSYKDVCHRLGVGSDCGICLHDAYQEAQNSGELVTNAAKDSTSKTPTSKF